MRQETKSFTEDKPRFRGTLRIATAIFLKLIMKMVSNFFNSSLLPLLRLVFLLATNEIRTQFQNSKCRKITKLFKKAPSIISKILLNRHKEVYLNLYTVNNK